MTIVRHTAAAEFQSQSDRKAQMVVGSDDTLTVWLNGKKVYDFTDRRGFEHEQGRFDVSLVRGPNRILVRCGNRGGGWQFSVAVTSAAEYAFLKAPSREGYNPETYRALALKGQGSAARGRQPLQRHQGPGLHQVSFRGQGGGTVGPELSSVGGKYPRDELISAVLYPIGQDLLGLMSRPSSPWRMVALSPGSCATRPREQSRSWMPTPRRSGSPRPTSTSESAATSP